MSPGQAPAGLRGDALVAQVAEQLGFLIPVAQLGAGAEVPWERVVEVGWNGPDGTAGTVWVCLEAGLAEALAANFGGPGGGPAEEDAAAAAGELANVISGNLLPVLYGDVHEFHLDAPREVPPVDPGGRREAALAFLEGRLAVAVDLAPERSRILRSVAPQRP